MGQHQPWGKGLMRGISNTSSWIDPLYAETLEG
jgi:hypothetical protein